MEDVLNHIHMLFHPLMELDDQYIDKSSILSRQNIKLLSYNIFIRPPPVKNNENDWKDERQVDFIKLLDNFDIVCLQEMFGSLSSRRQELIKYAYKSGLFFYVDVPAPSFFSKSVIDAGLIILSRFPILESEFRPFKYTVLACTLVEKGILYSKIKIKDTNLIIFNTHLQATYFQTKNGLFDSCVKTRISHIEETCEFIREIIDGRNITAEDRIILLGDFNVDAHNHKNKKKLLGEKSEMFNFQDEYCILVNELNKYFKTNDLWHKKYNEHPYTYGITAEGYGSPYDQVLTDKSDIENPQTLDYMFEIYINNKDEEKSLENKKLEVIYDSMKVEEFLVKFKPYQTLSDHFGISIELEYKNKNNLSSDSSSSV
jgi:endonuclease/exonuclease/phosphatase family metal-dependent hydrolase